MDFAVRDLDALGERAEMIAAIAAAFDPDPLAGRPRKLLDHGGRDCLLPRAFRHGLGVIGVGLGLIADRLEDGDSLLERRIVQIGDAGLDGVIEPLQPQFCFGRPLVQFGDMLAPAFGALLAAIED
ncbi:hypothetical protein QEV83_02210 [Methylocapsa sp. D3K7]|uniref:hypothetical protein n=1 Tax=Methylocapsa sp. D3K7 TaxID=3041435 RepID=UPI00244E96B3|nr:hypothetical protein [Methylocapsa sp. D3K7]WGJ15143.1 hypothetical protein QEV83_02210 [Methylocapsa sp. D3K7]